MTSIHQFSPVVTQGDGVSGSVLYIRSILRSLGFESDIFAWKSTEQLANEVAPLSRFNSKKCDLLLVHHSMGHEHEEWIRSADCPRVLVYHNITPADFFHPDSGEHYYATRGREQLREWQPLFRGAISVSPFNRSDLDQAGYQNITEIPLLVDLQKFQGDEEPPGRAWGLREDEQLIISVGRIAENKRQHLALDAFWHLKNMKPDIPMRLVLIGGTTSPGYHHQLLARTSELGIEQSVTLTGKCPDSELRWLYRNASALWCTSAHEGFCMPLVEANFFSLPAIAVATSNIPDTLGKSGLLLEDADPLVMAAVTARLLEDRELSSTLQEVGQDNLQRYSTETLAPNLRNYLGQLGFNP